MEIKGQFTFDFSLGRLQQQKKLKIKNGTTGGLRMDIHHPECMIQTWIQMVPGVYNSTTLHTGQQDHNDDTRSRVHFLKTATC